MKKPLGDAAADFLDWGRGVPRLGRRTDFSKRLPRRRTLGPEECQTTRLARRDIRGIAEARLLLSTIPHGTYSAPPVVAGGIP